VTAPTPEQQLAAAEKAAAEKAAAAPVIRKGQAARFRAADPILGSDWSGEGLVTVSGDTVTLRVLSDVTITVPRDQVTPVPTDDVA